MLEGPIKTVRATKRSIFPCSCASIAKEVLKSKLTGSRFQERGSVGRKSVFRFAFVKSRKLLRFGLRKRSLKLSRPLAGLSGHQARMTTRMSELCIMSCLFMQNSFQRETCHECGMRSQMQIHKSILLGKEEIIILLVQEPTANVRIELRATPENDMLRRRMVPERLRSIADF